MESWTRLQAPAAHTARMDHTNARQAHLGGAYVTDPRNGASRVGHIRDGRSGRPGPVLACIRNRQSPYTMLTQFEHNSGNPNGPTIPMARDASIGSCLQLSSTFKHLQFVKSCMRSQLDACEMVFIAT
jgi:hypothetical protein